MVFDLTYIQAFIEVWKFNIVVLSLKCRKEYNSIFRMFYIIKTRISTVTSNTFYENLHYQLKNTTSCKT